MPDAHTCEICTRTGFHMQAVMCRWIPGRVTGHRCRNVLACARRKQRLGLWLGTHVLRRRDPDGTAWTIQRARDGVNSSAPWFILTCEYREHRITSWHPSIDAAKAHRDDLVASMVARTMRAYAGGAQ